MWYGGNLHFLRAPLIPNPVATEDRRRLKNAVLLFRKRPLSSSHSPLAGRAYGELGGLRILQIFEGPTRTGPAEVSSLKMRYGSEEVAALFEELLRQSELCIQL